MSSSHNISWNFTDNREWQANFKNWPPVIITCAITGGMHSKTQAPNLPVSPEEQAEDFYKINRLIRERCPDIIINNIWIKS